ncbi:MAG: AraC family transcriptional regulator [Sphingomonadales bacterium]|nr:AraC family transcriptional regulator [Sphingomonadales bacterium]
MLKRIRRGVDGAIAPRAGRSRGGQPLSHNRAPSSDLAPWIARLYATVVDVPEGYRLSSGLFNDVSVIRIQLRGDWTAETADGPMRLGRAALVFGPHSRLMPVAVAGSFTSIGVQLRPGAGHALLGLNAQNLVDRIAPADSYGLPGAEAIRRLGEATSPEQALDILEGMVRQIIEQAGGACPDPVSARFEALSFTDPGASVAEFAESNGISSRQLERQIRRDFGLPPKQVLRRARALDMASHLRGVADEAEADEIALRYYDQSHLTREFTALFGISPRQFVEAPSPLLTLALESRQSRRLEAMDRITPGEPRPWQ